MLRMTILALLFLGPLLSSAKEDKVVVATDDWPPFRVFESNSEPYGVDIELLKYLERKLNIRTDVQKVPWIRALEMMRQGKADIMVGLARTQEREAFIAYAEPAYYSVRPAFYSLKERNLELNSYQDLKKHLIGYTRASAYFEPFDKDKSIKKFDVGQESQLIDLLLNKRIDFIIGSEPQVDFEIHQRKLRSRIEKSDYKPGQKTKLYLGISRQSSLLARKDEIEKALESFLSDGSLKNATRLYLTTPD